MQIRDHHVDELNPEERRNYTADSIDQKVLTKQGRGPTGDSELPAVQAE